ncbi:hypothetical protein NLC29_00255 [Candidatus Aminicenantes bacterium AH-873-B07]|jgi:uncharacterized membrane protein YkvI|nr:hypothetical protein [Candidatus Aminicenantes bacterium AH-873-B07]
MQFLNSSFFKKYLLPGFIFQSVVIAGGYGTGRELVEFFLNYGPLGGLLGMLLITTIMWSLILILTFEFSRVFRAYDYRTFFIKLLGSMWFLFEIIYFILLFIVLAVIGSAAGVLLRDNFGLPYMVGVGIMLGAIGFLTFKGSNLIEKFLSSWSIVLYIIYGIFLITALIKFGPEIKKNFSQAIIIPKWALGGFKYALYNMGIIPAVLFCLNHIERRKEAIIAGFLGGLIGIIPGLLFFISVVGFYPEILPIEVPAVYVLQKIGSPVLLIVFQIVLFGTLIETGTGFIHAVNERIQSSLLSKGKVFPQWLRPFIALILLLGGLGISTFGLINLIAKGYGGISWGFFLIYIIPLFTLGFYKLRKHS